MIEAHYMLLPTLVLIPILSGIMLLLTSRDNATLTKWSALGVSLVVFVLSLIMAVGSFNWSEPTGQLQLTSSATWIPPLGISFAMGVDAISMSLILLTTFIMPLTILGSFSAVKQRSREFYFWLLILQAAMIGVFSANDLILFYIFFEMTLIPMYFLIGIYGGTQKLYAARKFFIFTLSGSVFTFAGVLYIAWVHASIPGNIWTFNIELLTITAASQLTSTQQAWVLLALMAGFAVKVPLFPVHTWLPLAHTEAPTSGSVILAGVLLKLGTYGLVRFALPMAPYAVVEYAPIIAVLCIIGILYAAVICWVQSDVKKLVAYSSVSHLGFCVLGMFALNTVGVAGSVMYMINHGLSTGALFLCVGMIYERYHTRDMDAMSGLGKKMPVWATFMVFFCLASVGLPGLNGFVGEFLTIVATFKSVEVLGIGYAVFAAAGMILAAIYILYMVGKIVLGPVKEPKEYAGKVQDLNAREIATLTPLAAMCLILGIFPTPLLRSFEPAIENRVLLSTQQVIEQRAQMQSEATTDGLPMKLVVEEPVAEPQEVDHDG